MLRQVVCPYVRATPSLQGTQLYLLAKVIIFHQFSTFLCLLFEGQHLVHQNAFLLADKHRARVRQDYSIEIPIHRDVSHHSIGTMNDTVGKCFSHRGMSCSSVYAVHLLIQTEVRYPFTLWILHLIINTL